MRLRNIATAALLAAVAAAAVQSCTTGPTPRPTASHARTAPTTTTFQITPELVTAVDWLCAKDGGQGERSLVTKSWVDLWADSLTRHGVPARDVAAQRARLVARIHATCPAKGTP